VQANGVRNIGVKPSVESGLHGNAWGGCIPSEVKRSLGGLREKRVI
jgi:hypothetical protein